LPSSLRNFLIDRINLSESQIRQIIKDVAVGLLELHKNETPHLNIKPGSIKNFMFQKIYFLLKENIFYNAYGKSFKIGDIGFFSTIFFSQQQDKEFLDKKYSALELFETNEPLSIENLKSADIFSFGLVLYELITRKFRNFIKILSIKFMLFRTKRAFKSQQ